MKGKACPPVIPSAAPSPRIPPQHVNSRGALLLETASIWLPRHLSLLVLLPPPALCGSSTLSAGALSSLPAPPGTLLSSGDSQICTASLASPVDSRLPYPTADLAGPLRFPIGHSCLRCPDGTPASPAPSGSRLSSRQWVASPSFWLLRLKPEAVSEVSLLSATPKHPVQEQIRSVPPSGPIPTPSHHGRPPGLPAG